MSEPKLTAEERAREVLGYPDGPFEDCWDFASIEMLVDALEAHAAAVVAEVTRERDEARARIRELKAEVERLRVLRPWAEPFVPTTMLAVDKAFSLAELMHSRDVQLVLDTQMRAMVVSLRAALAPQAPKEVQL